MNESLVSYCNNFSVIMVDLCGVEKHDGYMCVQTVLYLVDTAQVGWLDGLIGLVGWLVCCGLVWLGLAWLVGKVR